MTSDNEGQAGIRTGLIFLACITAAHLFVVFVLLMIGPFIGAEEMTAVYSYGVKFKGRSDLMYFEPALGWYIEYGMLIELGLLIITAVGFRWYDAMEKTVCPQCKRVGAREDVGESIMGVFRRPVQILGSKDERRVPHAKYKLSHVCRYCGYEWSSIEARRV
jgi:hypothetical protein